MRYDVASLLREAVGSTRRYAVDEQVIVRDEAPRERVVGSAILLRTKAGVLVTAQLRTQSHEQCSRCLREAECPLSLSIEEEFLQSVDVLTGAPLPLPDDPVAFRIDTHHTLDLSEAVRQYWATALPMQPLCQPDCRGLCPRCGQDLNQGPCACPSEEYDARWAALANLRSEQEES
jgi:uncharacterized protein